MATSSPDPFMEYWARTNRLIADLMPMFGECLYCRDGQRVRLYRHEVGHMHAGDLVPETEYVCSKCLEWLADSAPRH